MLTFNSKKVFNISLLVAIVCAYAFSASQPAFAIRRPYGDGLTNGFGAEKQNAKSSTNRMNDLGGNMLSALKDVEKANSSFPPYIIESRTQGERIPRCHVRFVCVADKQNQQYKDGQKKKMPGQGGHQQQPYNHFRTNAAKKDNYNSPDEGRDFIPGLIEAMPSGSVVRKTMERFFGTNYKISGYNDAGNKLRQDAEKREVEADQKTSPHANFKKGANQSRGQSQGAGESFADAFNPAWEAMLQLHGSYLINVANEGAGQPCGGKEPVKVHENAVWMVMNMYKRVYLEIALLLLLPGAVLTQVKGLVSGGILQSQNDEDAVSPFSGILKGMVAIFLIPSTQLIVSYSCDIGNSMSYEVKRHINEQLLYEWADEQVFRAPEGNKKDVIKNPNQFPVLGKLSEGSEKESGVESQSEATVMLQTLVNLAAMSAAFALVMLCAFQITTMCYLMLLGPIAAAFYAWPSSVGTLFNRVFTTWVDAVVNVGLWRFWWTTVLLAAQTRIEWLQEIGQYNPYYEWEMIIFIAFIVILTYVPFNPFDFKAGEMVSQIMQKAEMAVSEATQKGGK